jgi:hypothetical protein
MARQNADQHSHQTSLLGLDDSQLQFQSSRERHGRNLLATEPLLPISCLPFGRARPMVVHVLRMIVLNAAVAE